MPWRTLCGFPPTAETVTLRVPNRAWRPDTVITDYHGNEMFVLLDQTNEMRSYEAVFGDLEGRRLVCIKRHLCKQFWKDGYYFCTYQPNWQGQPALTDRDVDNKRLYPFSYMQVSAMKGRFFYRLFNNDQQTGPPRMMAENPWMGFMVVCCTPGVRLGKWTAKFKKATTGKTTIHVDQWRNTVDVGPGNDLLAALCMAYIFDRYQCQPFITVFGREEEDEYEPDDKSISSEEYESDEEDKSGEDEEDENEQESLTPPTRERPQPPRNTGYTDAPAATPQNTASSTPPRSATAVRPPVATYRPQEPAGPVQPAIQEDDVFDEDPGTTMSAADYFSNNPVDPNVAPWDDASTVYSAATRQSQQTYATQQSRRSQAPPRQAAPPNNDPFDPNPPEIL